MKIGPSYFVRFSLDGAWFASCGQRTVHIRRTGDSKPTVSARVSHASGGAFAPDSKAFLLKTTSGALQILTPLEGTPDLKCVPSGSSEGADPRYSPCGRFIIDASWSGRLVILDATSGAPLEHREFVSDMLLAVTSPAGGGSWVVHHSPRITADSILPAPDYFTVWSLPLPIRPHRVIQPDLRFVRRVALSSSGEMLALIHGAPPTSLTLLDAHTGQTRYEKRVDIGGTGGRMTWTPAGELAVVERDCVRIYSATLAVRGEFQLKYACDVDFSPRGDLIAIGSWESGRVVPTSDILP